MKRLTVADVMTSPATSVSPATPFKEIVRAMSAGRFSAVPVLDEREHLVGIVTEADLLRKQEYQGCEDVPPILASRAERLARLKARGELAESVMTTPAITVNAHEPVRLAARLMARHRIKHLPVLDSAGRLVGIVSRSDLLRGYLRPDEQIRTEIRDRVLHQTLNLRPSEVAVAVTEGVVTLTGRLEFRSDAELVTQLAHAVDGVVDVHDATTFRTDDHNQPRARRGSIAGPAADWSRL